MREGNIKTNFSYKDRRRMELSEDRIENELAFSLAT
jgi:hypothetical protein